MQTDETLPNDLQKLPPIEDTSCKSNSLSKKDSLSRMTFDVKSSLDSERITSPNVSKPCKIAITLSEKFNEEEEIDLGDFTSDSLREPTDIYAQLSPLPSIARTFTPEQANDVDEMGAPRLNIRSGLIGTMGHEVSEISPDILPCLMQLEDDLPSELQDQVDGFRNAELFVVSAEMEAKDGRRALSINERLKVLEWIDENSCFVCDAEKEAADEKLVLTLKDINHVIPYGICPSKAAATFYYKDLYETIKTCMQNFIDDDNVIFLVFDFISLQPDYLQEFHNIGGRLPLTALSPRFGVREKFDYTRDDRPSLSPNFLIKQSPAYECLQISLKLDGTIGFEEDDTFQQHLPSSHGDLTHWALVCSASIYGATWKIVIMSVNEIREVLDFDEVFRKLGMPPLLPGFSGLGLRSSALQVFEKLGTEDLIVDEEKYGQNLIMALDVSLSPIDPSRVYSPIDDPLDGYE